MGTSPLPNPQLTPPLGGTVCPDPRWNGGRALVLQGPQTFLGALWVFTASLAGQPASSVGLPPPPPPGVMEGAIPFVEMGGAIQELQPPSDASEGSTAFIEDTAT
jgi:hypothetical protein